MKTVEEIIKELDDKIPRDCVSERQGGNGRSLSYLEGHYVIDRLNKVLGQGNWAYEANTSLVHSGEIETRSGPTYSVHYLARVRLVVTIGERTTEFVDYGYGDGSDKNNPGKAHELAVKESVTDGLKRCAKNLGMSMGLALYDKTQENVEDVKESIKKAEPSMGTNKRGSGPVTRITGSTNPVGGGDNKRVLIAETARVVIAKKKRTKEALVEELGKEFKVSTDGVNTAEDLAKVFLDKDVDNVLTYLKAHSA